MNHKISTGIESPDFGKKLQDAVETAPKAMKTAVCKSDAEWYFRQSAASREFYAVFFDVCHKYNVTWSQTSPAVRELISDLVKLTLDRNAAERKLYTALSSNDASPPK